MVDCDSILEHVSDFLEKRLSPQIKREFESHINNCSKCKLIVERVPRVQSLLFNTAKIQCSDNFNLRLRQRLAESTNKPFYANINMRQVSYGFSFAVVIFLAFLGFNMFTGADSGINNPVRQAQIQKMNSPTATTNSLSAEYKPVEELEVKTKNSETTAIDSTKDRRSEDLKDKIKYVDSK